jgi:hypothetical protein
MIVSDICAEDAELSKIFICVFDYDNISNDLIGKVELDMAVPCFRIQVGSTKGIALMDEKGFPEKCELYI